MPNIGGLSSQLTMLPAGLAAEGAPAQAEQAGDPHPQEDQWGNSPGAADTFAGPSLLRWRPSLSIVAYAALTMQAVINGLLCLCEEVPASCFTAFGCVLGVGFCCPGCLRPPLDQLWSATGLLSALHKVLCPPLCVTVHSCVPAVTASVAAASGLLVVGHGLSVST